MTVIHGAILEPWNLAANRAVSNRARFNFLEGKQLVKQSRTRVFARFFIA